MNRCRQRDTRNTPRGVFRLFCDTCDVRFEAKRLSESQGMAKNRGGGSLVHKSNAEPRFTVNIHVSTLIFPEIFTYNAQTLEGRKRHEGSSLPRCGQGLSLDPAMNPSMSAFSGRVTRLAVRNISCASTICSFVKVRARRAWGC